MTARMLTAALGGRWHGAYGTARCPTHDDRNPSLTVRDGDVAPLLTCWAGCERSAIIAALKVMGLWGVPATDPPPRQPPPPAPPAARYTELALWARRIWTECRPITATDPAGRYLLARGCALPHPDGDLRWEPRLRHPNGHVGPALVGLVTDVRDAGLPLNLHRTWIAGDGSGQKMFEGWLCGSRSRLLLKDHRKAGGCIRLWPDDWVTLGLGLAEGIETCLTLARAFTPVWSTIDAGNLACFPVLASIESITVAVDHDPAGLRAFDRLAQRWTTAGREVRQVLMPTAGNDLNDWCSDAA